jgi:hypothetical protein
MADAARILEEALCLASDQRARIAHELIESLDGDVGAEQARKVEAIRAALVEGEQSGIAEDSSLEGILTELRASRVR